MNGAEHYREAERCIELAKPCHGDDAQVWLAEAQAHATLALAAATAEATHSGSGRPGDATHERRTQSALAWRRALTEND